MRLSCPKEVILLTLLVAFPVAAQDVRVDVGKHAATIPKVCQSVVPATIEPTVDVPALVKEAICKGAGDMIIEYTYVMNATRREKDKKGNTKETTTTYEVFIPTLKSGMHTRGVLVVTARNGVAVPSNELEKERLHAAEQIEKQEAKIARETPKSEDSNPPNTGMVPLGMYTRSAINRSAFGMTRGSVALAVQTFLRTCQLSFLRREQIEGRETLVFKFEPRPDAQFNDNEKYIAQLNGEIWIDAKDRIVTRVIGLPVETRDANRSSAIEKSPAIYIEMMHLNTGIWLPHITRINGADYPKLFDGITDETISTYSNYTRFTTEVKDVKVEPPEN